MNFLLSIYKWELKSTLQPETSDIFQTLIENACYCNSGKPEIVISIDQFPASSRKTPEHKRTQIDSQMDYRPRCGKTPWTDTAGFSTSISSEEDDAITVYIFSNTCASLFMLSSRLRGLIAAKFRSFHFTAGRSRIFSKGNKLQSGSPCFSTSRNCLCFSVNFS